MLGDEPQRDLLARSADRGSAAGPAAAVRAGSKRSMITGQRSREVAEPARRGAELVAVLLVVALEPTGADAEDEAAVADVVDRAGHVGEQVRVAVRVAGDERADARRVRSRPPSPRAACTPRSARRAGSPYSGKKWSQTQMLSTLECVGRSPRVAQLVDGRGLRMQLHSDPEPASLRSCARRGRTVVVVRRRELDAAPTVDEPSVASPASSRRSGAPTSSARQPVASRLGLPWSNCVRSRAGGERRPGRGRARGPLREPRADHGDGRRETAVDAIGLGQPERGRLERRGRFRPRARSASAVPAFTARPSTPRIAVSSSRVCGGRCTMPASARSDST